MIDNNLVIRIPLCYPDIDETPSGLKVTYNLSVQTVDTIDNAILDEICKIAAEAGITELVVLDKKHIREALEKASAKKVKRVSGYRTIKACPTCDHELIYSSNYCDKCGQKIYWEDEHD